MPRRDVPKKVKITPKMIAKAVASPRTKQLRAGLHNGMTIDHQLLSHMPPSVPYDLSLLPAIATARTEAVKRKLVAAECVAGEVYLLKLPMAKTPAKAVRRRSDVFSRASKSRQARYAGSGAQG